MKITRFLFLLFVATCACLPARATDMVWWLVADGTPLMPLSGVSCLAGSDATGLITVVGTDTNVPNVAVVTFESKSPGFAASPVADAASATLVNNILNITAAKPCAGITVSSPDGRTVLRNQASESGTAVIDLRGAAPGVYIVNVGGDSSFKILKQ